MDPNFFEDARKRNIDMSLIEAGLRIAGGTSANPFENISAGATPALQSFTKEQSKLSGAQRLENLAALKAYQDSVAADKALAVDLYKAQQNAAAARGVSLQSARKTAMELAQQDMKDNYGGQQMSVYFRENKGARQQLLQKLFDYHLNTQLGIKATPVELFMPYGTNQAEFNADLDKQFEEILGKK